MFVHYLRTDFDDCCYMSKASIRTRYTAPLSELIRCGTLMVLVLWTVMIVIRLTFLPDRVAWVRWLVGAIGILIPVVFWLWKIREYRLEDGHLIIQQGGWSDRLPLAELKEFCADPKAMKGIKQIFGNGCMFAIYGFYWNKTLGYFRVYASDLKRAVILRFSHRTIVISPDSPEDFLRALEQLTKLNRAAESASMEFGKSYQA